MTKYKCVFQSMAKALLTRSRSPGDWHSVGNGVYIGAHQAKIKQHHHYTVLFRGIFFFSYIFTLNEPPASCQHNTYIQIDIRQVVSLYL